MKIHTIKMRKNRNHLHNWLEAHTPLGFPGKNEVQLYVALLTVSLIANVCRFVSIFDGYIANLYKTADRTVLKSPDDPSAYMPPFADFVEGHWSYAVLLIMLALFLIIYHYRYHHMNGSMSIYLMRRLPDKKDLFRRCAVLPIVMMGITFLAYAVLTGIYYFAYITLTPEVFL